jgi:hypothetical protein
MTPPAKALSNTKLGEPVARMWPPALAVYRVRLQGQATGQATGAGCRWAGHGSRLQGQDAGAGVPGLSGEVFAGVEGGCDGAVVQIV